MYRREKSSRDRKEGEDSPAGKFPLVNNIRIRYNYEVGYQRASPTIEV